MICHVHKAFISLSGQNYTCTFNPMSNLFFACKMIMSSDFQNLETAQCFLASHQESLLNEGLLTRDPGLLSIALSVIFYCVWIMTSVIVKRSVCRWTWLTAPITESNSRLRCISFQVSNNLGKTIPSHKTSFGASLHQITGQTDH